MILNILVNNILAVLTNHWFFYHIGIFIFLFVLDQSYFLKPWKGFFL